MSEIEDLIDRLDLIGYEKLADHGLALPIFGRTAGANVFYTARCTVPGEPNGLIAGFDLYEPAELIPLVPEKILEASVGQPWLDVFLWEESVLVGTTREIWDTLGEARVRLEKYAPLSLLTLAEGSGVTESLQLAQKAFSWLTARYGTEKALEWRNETYFRGIVLRTLRSELGTEVERPEIRRALQEDVIVRQIGSELYLVTDSDFAETEASENLAKAASVLGFDHVVHQVGVHHIGPLRSLKMGVLRPTVVAKDRGRTTETQMRIATLRVAAGKPQGRATTTELKKEVGRYIALTDDDLLPSKTRPNESMYQQIVGNIVSHRASKNNIFAKGWAIYTGKGIQITDLGLRYLRTLRLKD
jgi:hypothetical protein